MKNSKILLSALVVLFSIVFTTFFRETGQVNPEATPLQTIPPTVTRQQARVVRVIDGDTIEIEGGQKVRYIGINTPESDVCYSTESTIRNRELVEGRVVTLERDISETDKYGRLLRYVYSGELFINEVLVKEGYAEVSTFPPDVKYQDKFLEAQRQARENNFGFWSSCP